MMTSGGLQVLIDKSVKDPFSTHKSDSKSHNGDFPETRSQNSTQLLLTYTIFMLYFNYNELYHIKRGNPCFLNEKPKIPAY
jgi:hypothetical protein